MKVWPGRGMDARLEISFFINSDLGVNATRNPPVFMNSQGKFSKWVSSLDGFGKSLRWFKLGFVRSTASKFTIPILNPSQVLEQVSYWLRQGLRCHLGVPVAGGGTTEC